MKVEPLRQRWEVIALAPGTVLLVPLLAYGILGLFLAAIGVAINRDLSGAKLIALQLIAGFEAQSLFGIASLACLWVLALGGAARIGRLTRWRWIFAAFLFAGECDAAYFLLGSHVIRESITDLWSVLLWTVSLGVPMLLGLRYLALLCRQR